MCSTPKIATPTQYQDSKEPTYSGGTQSASGSGARSGRRGTILTGGSGVTSTGVTAKKTLLGQ